MSKLIEHIPLDKIIDPERPLRSNLTPESVDDLVFSIKEVGIIQPLTVCRSGDLYEIVAGHRRFLAAQVCQLTDVPCILIDTEGIDKEVLKMHENIGRQDINPIDWAVQLDYLKSQYKLTNIKLAEMTGFSESWVSEHLEIMNYPEEILVAIKNGVLAFSSARELAKIKDKNKRDVYVESAIKNGVTPRLANQWKLEANRPAPNYTTETELPNNTPDSNTLAYDEPVCPVCNESIPLEEIITLQVHIKCRPNNEITNVA